MYLLIDNFSKYIINWWVEPVVSGEIRVQTILDRYKQHHNQNKDVQLIVDGGPENNNHKMDIYLNSSEINIQKLIDLKDISFFNFTVGFDVKFKGCLLFLKHENHLFSFLLLLGNAFYRLLTENKFQATIQQ